MPSERKTSIEAQWNDAAVNLALRGLLGGFLSPDLWEAARIKLQDQYRRATGETDAVISITYDGRRDVRGA